MVYWDCKDASCLQATGINIKNLNLVWRSNRKAWMTSEIMKEWLRWFDMRMTGRQVVLLMDNFSAHEAAIASINASPSPLKNTLIIWLPPGSTSQYQPLDQGIIQAWKILWKNNGWGIRVWDIEIKPSIIENCFNKALQERRISGDFSHHEDIQEISSKLEQLRLKSRINDLMDIDQFLNPIDEVVEDSIEQLDDQILAQFGPEIEAESDEEIEVLPRITISEALEALKRLRLYEEQQEEGDSELIKALDRHEKLITGRKAS
ncbi:hypothetical protein T310_8250 [Rasamsonia emersonii CBS 393.64]|uniref:DDE-1 domain-containing protein n=1 Tax=Rasamsonia emersonii (strain ATCC 16479 / CBS 393.64 / IMI 116815) TaxID=1408163 RepID=A0A0F4YI65_RASE3|nr:hypothetical protein T310_8250 [Rasamsonia emersonii CBS 393.64]KKA17805.1 hypothetical protein T310_8250 [Rasamsonia emersonii CBS 393.64]